jgi:hypothetical protein
MISSEPERSSSHLELRSCDGLLFGSADDQVEIHLPPLLLLPLSAVQGRARNGYSEVPSECHLGGARPLTAPTLQRPQPLA